MALLILAVFLFGGQVEKLKVSVHTDLTTFFIIPLCERKDTFYFDVCSGDYFLIRAFLLKCGKVKQI